MTRKFLAILLLAVVAFLAVDMASAILFTSPLTVDITENDQRILFTTPRDVVIGRCAEVRWDVSEAKGVWINGQGRELIGSETLCISESFSRPQIYVLLPDDSGRVYELFVASVLYSPDVALRYTVQIVLIGILAYAAFWLLGWTHLISQVFLPLSEFLSAGLRRLDAIPNRVFYIALIVIFVVYVGISLYQLRPMIPAQPFLSEDYLNDMTIGEAWQNAIRPLTLPLVYKLLSNNVERIAAFQWIVAVIGWGMLAGAVAIVLKSKLLKITGFCVILCLSLSRDIAFWNSMLLSESLSNALFVVLIALALLIGAAIQRKALSVPMQFVAGLIVLICAFFWSQTRDTNSYFLLGIAGLIVLVSVGGLIMQLGATRGVVPTEFNIRRGDSPSRPCFVLPFIVVIGFVAIYVQQNRHADAGLRWQYSLVNVMAHRILPYPDKTQFFVDRGMPNTPEVMAYAGQGNFAWSFDLDFPAFGDWIDQDAKRVYVEYLLSRPVESLTEPLIWWNRLLLYERDLLTDYMSTPVIPAWQKPITAVFYTETWGLLVLSAAGLVIFGASVLTRGWDWRYAIPIALLLLVYPIAFLNWHGDSHAVERHALHVALQWRLAMWFFILFAVDRAFRPFKRGS